jgi:hypothetical protein
MSGLIGIVAFILIVCFVAGFILAQRVGKTPTQVFFLSILFGIVFQVALCGLAFAGCVAVFVTAAASG